VAARLEAIRDKTNTNLVRLKTEAERQEKMDANLKEIKEDIKANRAITAGTKATQAKADADREHMQEMITTNQERIETKKDANLRDIIVEMKNG
jgi:polyribonucleotide nucleotidyltransferase